MTPRRATRPRSAPTAREDLLRQLPGGRRAAGGGVSGATAALKTNWYVLELARRLHEAGRTELPLAGLAEVLDRADVPPSSSRAAVGRLVDHDMLQSWTVDGRRFVAPTNAALAVFAHVERSTRAPFDPPFDGTWTVVVLTVPESRRSSREALRVRLRFLGFGPLDHGVWIAPGRPEVLGLLHDLAGDVVVMEAAFPHEQDLDARLHTAFSLDELRAEHAQFLARWGSRTRPVSDVLGAWLQLSVEWSRLAGLDPRLPLDHLPRRWPASRSERAFLRWDGQLAPRALAQAASLMAGR
jgi:phenylacetic acid degradation operon negative regulatory protein